MPIASVIVESLPGAAALTGEALAALGGISVYGSKEERIVTVIEGESPAVIDGIMRQVLAMESVIGVYPVYAGGYDE